MAQSSSIVCKDCSHVNEAQRVYCHNCGVKLDRSAVAQQLQKQNETAEQKQKRVKKAMNPSGGLLGKNWGSTFIRTIFWAAVAGLVINIALPPENVPPMPPKDQLLDAPPLGAYLQDISISPTPRVLAFKEDEINSYLLSTLRPKGKKGEAPGFVSFQRAFVNLDPGQARIISQSAIFEHPLYLGVTFAAEGKAGRLSARPVALHLGRVTVPEFMSQHLAKPIELLFASLWGALREEQRGLNSLGALEIRENAVIVASPNTAIPPAQP